MCGLSRCLDRADNLAIPREGKLRGGETTLSELRNFSDIHTSNENHDAEKLLKSEILSRGRRQTTDGHGIAWKL